MLDVHPEDGFVLVETAPGVGVEEVRARTGAPVHIRTAGSETAGSETEGSDSGSGEVAGR